MGEYSNSSESKSVFSNDMFNRDIRNRVTSEPKDGDDEVSVEEPTVEVPESTVVVEEPTVEEPETAIVVEEPTVDEPETAAVPLDGEDEATDTASDAEPTPAEITIDDEAEIKPTIEDIEPSITEVSDEAEDIASDNEALPNGEGESEGPTAPEEEEAPVDNGQAETTVIPTSVEEAEQPTQVEAIPETAAMPVAASASEPEGAPAYGGAPIPEGAYMPGGMPTSGGAPMPDALAASVGMPQPGAMPAATPEQQGTSPKKKLQIKPWMIAVALVLVAVLGVGGWMVKRASDYNHAVDLFEQGEYQEASETFGKLGNYKDSEELYTLASGWAEAQAKENSAGHNPKTWEAAAKAYEAIDDSKAKKEAERCRNTAVYYEGTELLKDGQDDRKALQDAQKKFESCGGVLDADDKITECKDGLAYLDAKDLMKKKKWADARTKLEGLNDKSYRDSKDLIKECSTWEKYEEAESYFNNGQFYEAYTRFDALGSVSYDGMPDMSERMKACEQSYPSSGALYVNDSYAGDSCELTIENNGDHAEFYKLYQGNDLAVTIFIQPHSSATVSLSSGTYHMNEAYGDTWYGDKDMFGDKGAYFKCNIGGSESFDLEYGYVYTISSEITDGTSVGGSRTDRGSM